MVLRRMFRVGPLIQDFRPAAFWAGITAFIWYAFGGLPLQVSVIQQLGLDAAQASSWIFVTWQSTAIFSLGVSLYYRQPIAMNWTIPPLLYLGTLGGRFTYPEMVGANLIAGIVIVVLGLLGIGKRVMDLVPLPIVMGMFAGSILGYVTRMVETTITDTSIAGVVVAGYVVGRAVNNSRIPPVGLALISGGIAVFLFHRSPPAAFAWGLPAVDIPTMSFTFPAFVAVSLPVVVLSMGLGNIEGLGFLRAQGYRLHTNAVTVLVGIQSVVNAMLGGHPASVGRAGVAIVASPDAGPMPTRYWGNLITAPLITVVALASGVVISLLEVLPRSYVVTVGGLAVLTALQNAFETAFGSKLRFGSLVALVVGAVPFIAGGITSAFWAIPAGILASIIAERRELFVHRRREGTARS